MSPFTALSLLLLFKQRRMTLTFAQFDTALDTLIDVLEEANNEKHRLEDVPED